MNSKVPIVIFLAILVVAGGYVVTQNNSGSVQSEVDVSVSDVEVELDKYVDRIGCINPIGRARSGGVAFGIATFKITNNEDYNVEAQVQMIYQNKSDENVALSSVSIAANNMFFVSANSVEEVVIGSEGIACFIEPEDVSIRIVQIKEVAEGGIVFSGQPSYLFNRALMTCYDGPLFDFDALGATVEVVFSLVNTGKDDGTVIIDMLAKNDFFDGVVGSQEFTIPGGNTETVTMNLEGVSCGIAPEVSILKIREE